MIGTSSWPADSYRSSYGNNEKTTTTKKKTKIDIFQGKIFSSNQSYNNNNNNNMSSSHHNYRSSSPPLPPPPSSRSVTKSSKKSSSSKTSTSSWSFDDPEMKRRTRVAKYKIYAVEGKVKSSFKKGFRWIKKKCSKIVHGY